MKATMDATVLGSGVYGADRGEPLKRTSDDTEVMYLDLYDEDGAEVLRIPVEGPLNADVAGLVMGERVKLTTLVFLDRRSMRGGGDDARQDRVIEKFKLRVVGLDKARAPSRAAA